MDSNIAKKRNIKIIVSETIMVITVIMTVIILALLVSGYWLNSDFEVEQSGMLQISSTPTGATVEIDGEASSWLQRTNTSKILNSGEHTVRLTRDGYDDWSKTITISEGLLYRLHYPRLFLLERTSENLFATTDYVKASVSPDRNSLLLINGTTKWTMLNLDADTLSQGKSLDISQLFSSVSLASDAEVGLFTGEIISMDWDYDSSHVLIEVQNKEATEWVVLDINNISKSANLTRDFGYDFSHIEIIDNNSNNLLAIQNGNLRQIDLSNHSISSVIATNVTDFDHFGNEVVFATTGVTADGKDSKDSKDNKDSDNASAVHSSDHNGDYVGYFKLGDSKITRLEDITAPAKVAISKFYDSKFIAVISNQLIVIHQKDNYLDDAKTYQISFMPDNVEVGHNGEFLLLSQGQQLATLDMEAASTREWSIEPHYGWLDNDMLYAVSGGELIVYDFDGLNRRTLAHNVSSHFPVTITSDKWLYYFSDGSLMREWLISR